MLENKIDYVLVHNINDYKDVLDLDLKELLCKHIIGLDSDLAKDTLHIGLKADYYNVLWGAHKDCFSVVREKRIIDEMVDNLEFNRPIRLTKDFNSNYWGDNTHSIIAYILRGYTKVGEIPFYIVDVSGVVNKVVSHNNSVRVNDYDINKALTKSLKANKKAMFHSPNKPIWRIKNLMEQIDDYDPDNGAYKDIWAH